MISANLIGWIITLAFVLILVVGFFIGFWRGLKRSTVNIVMAIIGVIVAFLVTPSITKMVLGINITVNDTQTTIEGAVVELLKSDPDIKNLMLANENLKIFFMNLPRAIFNTVIFIILTIAVEFVLYIIYKILALTVFKVKKEQKKHAVLGGVVGLVKTFLVTVLAFMPFASLIGIANNLLTTDNYGIVYTSQTEKYESSSVLKDKLPETAENIIVGLENNMLTKMSGMFGLDNAMFDYYSSFEIDDEKLYIRKEVDNVYKIVDFSYQVSNANLKDVNFVTLRYDKILQAVENTTESTLFKKVVSETLADIFINYENYDFIANSTLTTEYKDILDNVRAHLLTYPEGKVYEYFQNDLVKAVSAIKVLGQSGIINGILDLEENTIEATAAYIANDDNINALKNTISDLVDINIVRDGIARIVKEGLSAVSQDIDPVGATTTDWTEDDWTDFKTSLTNIIDNFGDISNEINVMDVLKDATILLDDAANYDIELITSKLGSLVDEIRNNKLLKTADNQPVVDKLLEKNKITLPATPVKDINGETTTITNYKEYFDFITPSLLKIRDEKVFKVIDDISLSSSQKITRLAEIISEESNEKLLNQIILPLYQVEPTKSLIVDELSNSLQGDLINFSTLTNYDAWDKDLTYISTMLKELNSLKVEEKTYLSMALEGNIDGIVDNLTEENVEKALLPILYAKSTSSLRDKLFTNIKTQLEDVSGATCTLDASQITLQEGASEDQAQEICDVFKKLITVSQAIDDGATIKTIDKTILGDLLNTMKLNAYRTNSKIANKTETGIFNSAFVNLMSTLKTEYATEVEFIESQPEIMAELGVDNLAEENYAAIDYSLLLSKIAEAESLV